MHFNYFETISTEMMISKVKLFYIHMHFKKLKKSRRQMEFEKRPFKAKLLNS